MPTDSNNFYASEPVRHLFAQEIAALAPILGGVYGTFGLFLRAHPSAPTSLPAHLLGSIIDLALESSQRFGGRLSCAPAELPLANESCKLVIAQHIFERLDDPAASIGELARVLAPEGVALVLGFNPVSLWRPWLAGKARGTAMSLRPQSAQNCQQILASQGVETLQTRYLGASTPWLRRGSNPPSAEWRWPLLGRIGGSWLLLARKRRSAMTPLRLRLNTRELAINPRFAPGARRECA
jgi:SAM-dependent methyltransferase